MIHVEKPRLGFPPCFVWRPARPSQISATCVSQRPTCRRANLRSNDPQIQRPAYARSQAAEGCVCRSRRRHRFTLATDTPNLAAAAACDNPVQSSSRRTAADPPIEALSLRPGPRQPSLNPFLNPAALELRDRAELAAHEAAGRRAGIDAFAAAVISPSCYSLTDRSAPAVGQRAWSRRPPSILNRLR
jgi:hypothetical protein